jgi:hypothetical protein
MYKFYLFTLTVLVFQMFFPDAYAQRKAIAGDIIDSVTGKKISNVNIFESMAGVGTITNPAGNFRLLLNQGSVHLSVSFNGYKTWMKEFILRSDTIMNVTLQPLKEPGSDNNDGKQSETGTKPVVANHSHKQKN